MSGRTPLLAIEGLTVRFGGLVAVNDVSFAVAEGSVHGLIGPNGAGKTTAFNLISGLYTADAGKITLGGAPLVGKPTWERARCGLARTFQNIRMFAEMTALENVMAGAHRRVEETLASSLFRLPSFRDAERSAVAQAQKLLAFVGLGDAAGRRAGALPYGDQRRLEIARALASQPTLLMLDEPAAGMNPSETTRLVDLLVSLKESGLTILIVEHDMHFIMRLCDRITVLNFGRKIAEGAPADIRADPAVIEAYLGAKGARSLETAAGAGAIHTPGGTIT